MPGLDHLLSSFLAASAKGPLDMRRYAHEAGTISTSWWKLSLQGGCTAARLCEGRLETARPPVTGMTMRSFPFMAPRGAAWAPVVGTAPWRRGLTVVTGGPPAWGWVLNSGGPGPAAAAWPVALGGRAGRKAWLSSSGLG